MWQSSFVLIKSVMSLSVSGLPAPVVETGKPCCRFSIMIAEMSLVFTDSQGEGSQDVVIYTRSKRGRDTSWNEPAVRELIIIRRDSQAARHHGRQLCVTQIVRDRCSRKEAVSTNALRAEIADIPLLSRLQTGTNPSLRIRNLQRLRGASLHPGHLIRLIRLIVRAG